MASRRPPAAVEPATRKPAGSAVDGKAATQFKPGESGNPSGGNKVTSEFREWCRLLMDRTGRTELERLLGDPASDDRVRIKALELVAAYAYGKPRQEIGVEVTKDLEIRVNLIPPDMIVRRDPNA